MDSFSGSKDREEDVSLWRSPVTVCLRQSPDQNHFFSAPACTRIQFQSTKRYTWTLSTAKQLVKIIVDALYRGADKSSARPGRKQARKHVRDVRDFSKIQTRAVIKYFPTRQGAEGNSRHSDKHQLVSFLVGLRTYQHPCNILSTCKAPKEIHAVLTETVCFLPGWAKDLSAPL